MYLGHAYLPHVYDEISFSASLQGRDMFSLSSLSQLLGCRRPLIFEVDVLWRDSMPYGFDVLDICWTPDRVEGAAVVQLYKSLVCSKLEYRCGTLICCGQGSCKAALFLFCCGP